MIIQKLNWAGVKITCNEKIILVDAVENFEPYFPVLGKPLTAIEHFAEGLRVDYILLTHLHLDHFDAGVIKKCLKPAGKIVGYSRHLEAIAALDVDYRLLDNDESLEEQGIIFKSVYSMDGIGEEQTAWIIQQGAHRIFHGGDTIWHNQFWRLGRENPGINYAFLPVNGVKVNFGMVGLPYSSVPASLTPEQAFNAAKLLGAGKLVPMHYEKFATAVYSPVEAHAAVFDQYSKLLKQDYQLLPDGACLK